MAEFIQLTIKHCGASIYLRSSSVQAVYVSTETGATVIAMNGSNLESVVEVRESPAEVLALLAGGGEGKAEGIQDVVKKLWFVRDDAALRKAAAADTEITLVMRFDQLDRLVAYFDGRA